MISTKNLPINLKRLAKVNPEKLACYMPAILEKCSGAWNIETGNDDSGRKERFDGPMRSKARLGFERAVRRHDPGRTEENLRRLLL